jgi:hypothetical protein
MRVDYTLPALQPGISPDLPTAQETGRSFREQIRSPTVQLPVSWEQQLRLDARPFTGTYIGPPPRPHTLQLYDAETERSRWRNLLWRHGRSAEAAGEPNPSTSRPSVQVMLEMLLGMQQMEDTIMSRQVAVTRG